MEEPLPYKVVWLVTYATMPGMGGTGGCDWYYKREDALKEFNSYPPFALETVQLGLLSVPVPTDWTHDQIDEYICDVYNLLPYPSSLAE